MGSMLSVHKETGTFLSFDNTSIYYEVHGTGDPLILCYGLGCPINHWHRQISHFSQTHQVIAFDHRGLHGSSMPAHADSLTIQSIARDMNSLMEHLKIEKASFWGHSFGVPCVFEMYQLYPEKVSSFVLVNGFTRNPFPDMPGISSLTGHIFDLVENVYAKQPIVASTLWRLAIRSPYAYLASALVGGFNLRTTKIEDLEKYFKAVAQIDLDTFFKYLSDLKKFDATALLTQIKVPTLVISGALDTLTPKSHQREQADMIHGAEYCLVDYGSHCTQLDSSDYINLRIEKFFLNQLAKFSPPTETKPSQKMTSPLKKKKNPKS